jgi:hypothetical protein
MKDILLNYFLCLFSRSGLPGAPWTSWRHIGLCLTILILPWDVLGQDSRRTLSIAASPAPDIPDYVGPIDEDYIFDILYKGDMPDWIHFGVEHRNRLEHRDQNYQAKDINSQLLLLGRTLVYGQIRDILGPLRIHTEIINSRDIGGNAPETMKNLNFYDLQQAYAEIVFPEYSRWSELSLKAGRQSFDFVDRRLVARNRFRNTINSFDGLRLTGQVEAPANQLWGFEFFALRPVNLQPTGFDRSNDYNHLFGAALHDIHVGHLTLEPYYLITTQKLPSTPRNNLQTAGLHGFGQIPQENGSAWDYDMDLAFQVGSTPDTTHEFAWASHVELGYTSPSTWTPRFALWVNSASPDFNSLYGSTFAMYGFSGFFAWENFINPSAQLTLNPSKRMQLDLIHRLYWLNDPEVGWKRTSRVNPPGQSERFIGSEFDVRLGLRLTRLSTLDAGMAFFFPGSFSRASGQAPFASLYYAAVTLKL